MSKLRSAMNDLPTPEPHGSCPPCLCSGESQTTAWLRDVLLPVVLGFLAFGLALVGKWVRDHPSAAARLVNRLFCCGRRVVQTPHVEQAIERLGSNVSLRVPSPLHRPPAAEAIYELASTHAPDPPPRDYLALNVIAGGRYHPASSPVYSLPDDFEEPPVMIRGRSLRAPKG